MKLLFELFSTSNCRSESLLVVRKLDWGPSNVRWNGRRTLEHKKTNAPYDYNTSWFLKYVVRASSVPLPFESHPQLGHRGYCTHGAMHT